MADDRTTTVQQLKEKVAEFVAERKWEPYHSPRNLAGSVSIEAAELLEIFQWEDIATADAMSNRHLMDRIRDEAADIVIYILSLANSLDMDLSDAIERKIGENRKKYPA